jgi:hypothetical protein
MFSFRQILSTCTALSLLAACGSSVETVGGGGHSTTGAGSTGSTTTDTFTGSTTGGGGSAGCAGVITVHGDGAVAQLSSECPDTAQSGATSANGWLFAGGPVGAPHGLTIEGCAAAIPGSRGLRFDLFDASAPGSFASGSVTYHDADGVGWGVGGDPFTVEVQTLPPVGGVITGAFKANLTQSGGTAHLALDGDIAACHTTDLFAP